MQASAARHIQGTGANAIHFMEKINAVVVAVGRLNQHCACAVAKDHTGGAVGVINNGRHYIGADHQYLFVRTGFDKLNAGLKRVDKS